MCYMMDVFFFFLPQAYLLSSHASSMLEVIHIITALIIGHYSVQLCTGWSQSTTADGSSILRFYARSMLICLKIEDVEWIYCDDIGAIVMGYISLSKEPGTKCWCLYSICVLVCKVSEPRQGKRCYFHGSIWCIKVSKRWVINSLQKMLIQYDGSSPCQGIIQVASNKLTLLPFQGTWMSSTSLPTHL